MIHNQKDVEDLLKDSGNHYYTLRKSSLNRDVSDTDYIPEDPLLPNAFRYMVGTVPDENGMREAYIIENMELKEAVVKRLKEIHGIVDPWDREPEVYAEKWRKAHESHPKLSQEEWEKARKEALEEALAEEKAKNKKR